MGVAITPVVIVGGMCVAWTMRAGPQFTEYGDPYTTSAYITRKPHDEAFIETLSGPMLTPDEIRELGRLFQAEGVRLVKWERRRLNGYVHTATILVERSGLA